MGTQQFCLRWNNHQTNLLAVFDQLLQNEAFVDVTLACEGLSIKAHKMVLSACSPYFQSLFLDNPCQHPIVILKDMRFSELKAVVDFMYKGEVNVSQDQLSALLKTAETLKVKGLAEVTGSSPPGSGGDITRSALGVGPPNQGGPPPSSTEGRLSPPPKRKRGRPTKRPSTDGEQLEVVESLVDVVPDGPDSVPPAQERSTEQSSVQGMELLTDAPTTISDHAHNTSEMAYDGPTQEQNSRDSSMILADQTQSSSSSLGHLPATASTSGMSPGQGLRGWSSQQAYKMWTKEAMYTALKAVFARRMTYQQACDHFSIPVPTFYYYMSRVRKVLKPLERDDYEPAAEPGDLAADQLSIKGRHGKRLNIAENDLNAAILSVVCRTGKLAVPSDSGSVDTPSRSSGFGPTSPGDDSFQSPSGDMDFMNRMNVKPRGRQRSWKQEDMYNAIKAIMTNQMSLAKASRQFGIPYPTLKVYLKKVGNMNKPPEWGEAEPASWPATANVWSFPGSSLPTANQDQERSGVYSRKLTIGDVYSESSSDSGPDDDDDDDPKVPFGPLPEDKKMPALTVTPVITTTITTSVVVNTTPTITTAVTTASSNMNITDSAADIKISSTASPNPTRAANNAIEQHRKSFDSGEDDAAENEEDETNHADAANEKDDDDDQERSGGRENDDDEHDNRPSWIEVLTLD